MINQDQLELVLWVAWIKKTGFSIIEITLCWQQHRIISASRVSPQFIGNNVRLSKRWAQQIQQHRLDRSTHFRFLSFGFYMLSCCGYLIIGSRRTFVEWILINCVNFQVCFGEFTKYHQSTDDFKELNGMLRWRFRSLCRRWEFNQ